MSDAEKSKRLEQAGIKDVGKLSPEVLKALGSLSDEELRALVSARKKLPQLMDFGGFIF